MAPLMFRHFILKLLKLACQSGPVSAYNQLVDHKREHYKNNGKPYEV